MADHPAHRSLVPGIAFAASGAILFASKGLFAKALYAQGVDFQTLTTLRAVMSLPLFVLLAMHRGFSLAGRSRRAIAWASLAGILCYGVGALIDFWALELIDISIERALMFSYPALVVAWTALVRRRWPTRPVVVALCLTYVGILLVVGGFDPVAWRQNLTGSLMVLFCACTTAGYFLTGERCIPELGSMGFTVVAMSAAAVSVCVHYVATHRLAAVAEISPHGWVLLFALAILCMFLPTLLQAEGIRRVGAERGALSGTIGPPAALAFGMALLGERPLMGQLVGTAMVVIGVFLIARTGDARALDQPPSAAASERDSRWTCAAKSGWVASRIVAAARRDASSAGIRPGLLRRALDARVHVVLDVRGHRVEGFGVEHEAQRIAEHRPC